MLSDSSKGENSNTDTECCEFSLPAPTGHHSSQDHALQCWEDMLEAAIQQCNSMDAPTMSRTSSEEELATIFGDQDTPVSMPHSPPTSTPPPTQEATYQLFPEEAVKDIDTDFIHKWWEMRNQFLLQQQQQQQSGDHHNLTTTPRTSAERELESENVDLQYPGQNKIYGFQTLSTPQNFPVPPASGDFSFGLTQQQQSGDYHNIMTTTPWSSAESKNVIGYHSHTQNSVEFDQHLGHGPQTPPNFPVPPARAVSSFGLIQPFTASTLQQPSEPAGHHCHGFPLSAFSTEPQIGQSGHYHSGLFLETKHVTLTHTYAQFDCTTTTTAVFFIPPTGEPAIHHCGGQHLTFSTL